MLRTSLLTLAAFLTCTAPLRAQTAEMSPTELAEFFLQAMTTGEIAAAFDSIAAASPAISNQGMLALKSQVMAVVPMVGEPIGFEKSSEKFFADSLVERL